MSEIKVIKNRITKEMRAELRKPLPPEAISQHPTKTFLSTIKAIYITERLNDVFGIGRWTMRTKVAQETPDYVLMRGKFKLLDYPDLEIPIQYGGHATTGKNTELADGYKSAITDCISKCASYLEIGIDVFKGVSNSGKRTTNVPAKRAPVKNVVPSTTEETYPEPAQADTSNILEKNICNECGIGVSQKVADWSEKKYGEIYCFDCQKKQ